MVYIHTLHLRVLPRVLHFSAVHFVFYKLSLFVFSLSLYIYILGKSYRKQEMPRNQNMPSFPIKHKNDSSFNYLVSVLRMLLTFLVVLFISVTPVIGEVPVYSPVNTSCSKPWFVWQNHSCKCGNSLRRTVYCSADGDSYYQVLLLYDS